MMALGLFAIAFPLWWGLWEFLSWQKHQQLYDSNDGKPG